MTPLRSQLTKAIKTIINFTTMNIETVLLLILFLLILIFVVVDINIIQPSGKTQRLRRFKGRKELPLEEFISKFYSDIKINPEVVSEVLNVVGTALDIPLGLLRPSDKFNEELAPPDGHEFSDGIVDIDFYLSDYLKKGGYSLDKNLDSIDDLIRFIANKKA